MDNQQKRNITFLTIGLIFMLSGIEYAVILPTIWRYLQILEAPPYFLGLGLSAFSLSALLTGPLFGVWSDRSKTTKSIILFSNLFEIAGNFMYFIGYSKWLLLSSRLVAGVGAGAGSSIFGFLTRSTLPEERAGIFAAIMACRQAGLLVGPAFNLFLRLCDFKLGPFVVNKYTSPGIFMCLLWTLLQFVIMAAYWDVPPVSSEGGVIVLELKQEEKEEEEEVPLIGSDEEATPTYRAVNSDQCETSTLTESEAADEESNPFKNFSVSRGRNIQQNQAQCDRPSAEADWGSRRQKQKRKHTARQTSSEPAPISEDEESTTSQSQSEKQDYTGKTNKGVDGSGAADISLQDGVTAKEEQTRQSYSEKKQREQNVRD